MKEITTNCPLCEQRSLSIMEQEKSIQQDSEIAENVNTFKNLQCLNCGYASSDKFAGSKSDNEEYSKLTTEMQDWAIEQDGRIWIPAMLTLPFGMVYPLNVDNMVNHKTEMKWALAEMKSISKEEQKEYPIEDGSGFYTKRYDIENAIQFDTFLGVMQATENIAQQEIDKAKNRETVGPSKMSKLNLPKLKKK